MTATPNRFLGFALAAADVLFEVAADGMIGSVEGVGSRDRKLCAGGSLRDVLMEESAVAAVAMLAGGAPKTRAGPIPVLLQRPVDGHRVAMLSAYRETADASVVCCAMSYEKAKALATLDADGLVSAATSVQASGTAISMVEIGDLGAAMKGMPGSAAASLMHDVEAVLGAASIDGRSVSCMGGDRYAVVHAADKQDAILDGIRAAGARAGVELSPAAAGLALPDDDPMVVAAALRSVLSKFMSGGLGDGGSLKDFFERAVSEIRLRVASFLTVVKEQKVKLLFQPIVDLATGQVHHHEVLARFGHTEDTEGMIRTAEDLRLITRFDITVAERAVARLRKEAASGLKLAINVSSLSLESDDYLVALTAFTATAPDIRERLFLEVTETAAITDLTPVAKRIGQLRDAGFRIYIDDFGAGAASLDYIRAFPVDAVKIDGKFVREASGDPRAVMMIRHIVQLCASLGLDTVAEQVETEDVARLMRECGVKYGQGWLWGKAEAVPLMAIAAPMVAAA